jgi:hypothetical protein
LGCRKLLARHPRRASYMKLPSLIGAASLSVICLATARAEPTAPVDPSQRNGAFVPASAAMPEAKSPVLNPGMQDRRLNLPTLDKTSAAIGDRRAATDVQETREKKVREKTASRPEAIEQATSTFNHRVAPFTTSESNAQPPVVSKYQDGLKAASAANMARFPALDRATAVKLNRFVFRKNAPEPAPVTSDAPITRAGSGPADESAKVRLPIRN